MGFVIEELGDGGEAALMEYLARSVDYVANVQYRPNGVLDLVEGDFRLEELEEDQTLVLRPVDDEGHPVKGARRVKIHPAWIDTIKFY